MNGHHNNNINIGFNNTIEGSLQQFNIFDYIM